MKVMAIIKIIENKILSTLYFCSFIKRLPFSYFHENIFHLIHFFQLTLKFMTNFCIFEYFLIIHFNLTKSTIVIYIISCVFHLKQEIDVYIYTHKIH